MPLDKCIHIIVLYLWIRNGGERLSPKGRPTDDPKTLSTRIRLSEDDVRRLEFCTQKTGMTKAEIIRKGIKEVYERLKE